jgi:hypothetical protein
MRRFTPCGNLKLQPQRRGGAEETQRKALTAKARRRNEKAAKNFRISDFVFLLFSFGFRRASAVVDLFFLAPWRLYSC